VEHQRTKGTGHLGTSQRTRGYLACFAVAVLALVASTLAVVGPAQALDSAGVGPTDPLMKGFPAYYTDDAGRALQLCVNGRPKCDLARRSDLTPPEGEAFYWAATAELHSPGIDVSVEMALEAAFAGQRPMVFDRLRIRGHVSQAGTYTITHPYGTTTVQATDPAEQRNVNFTRDIGCAPGPRGACTFASATQGRITSFLKQVGAPRGYLGNPARFRPVASGDTVAIRGPAGSDSTDRFSVMGRRAKARSVSMVKVLTFSHARSKRVRIKNIGLERIRVRSVKLVGDNTLRRVQSPRACSRGDVLRVGKSCTVGIRFNPNGRFSHARLLIRDDVGKVRTTRIRATTR
jgi:hypothetical protein